MTGKVKIPVKLDAIYLIIEVSDVRDTVTIVWENGKSDEQAFIVNRTLKKAEG